MDGPIGQLRLTRPEKLNALDREALEGITIAAAEFNRRPDVKVVIVSGEGPSFCAGFDLSDPSWTSDGPYERSAAVGRSMAEALDSMVAITIASIRGHCIGGGVVLAAACDLRVASTTTQFRIPEADLGVPLYWTGVPRLVRELGPALTKELILTARAFDAAEARSIRFVNHVVDDGELESSTLRLAQEIASRPAFVLRVTEDAGRPRCAASRAGRRRPRPRSRRVRRRARGSRVPGGGRALLARPAVKPRPGRRGPRRGTPTLSLGHDQQSGHDEDRQRDD